MIQSDDLLREQAYLVARGVRSLALVGINMGSDLRKRLALVLDPGAGSLTEARVDQTGGVEQMDESVDRKALDK